MYALLIASMISLLDLNEATLQENIDILECPAGVTLPLTLRMQGDFLSFEVTPQVSLLQTCYIRHGKKDDLLFSTDLKKWQSFADFFTGEIKAFVNEGPVAGLELTLARR